MYTRRHTQLSKAEQCISEDMLDPAALNRAYPKAGLVQRCQTLYIRRYTPKDIVKPRLPEGNPSSTELDLTSPTTWSA